MTPLTRVVIADVIALTTVAPEAVSSSELFTGATVTYAKLLACRNVVDPDSQSQATEGAVKSIVDVIGRVACMVKASRYWEKAGLVVAGGAET